MHYDLDRASTITGVPKGHLELWTELKAIKPAADGYTATNLLEAMFIKTLIERGLGMPLIKAILKNLKPRREGNDFFNPAVLQDGDGRPCYILIAESFKQLQESCPPARLETAEDYERAKEYFNPTLPRDLFYIVDVFFCDVLKERDALKYMPEILTAGRQVMIINLFALGVELERAL